jgi:hypothetical protein
MLCLRVEVFIGRGAVGVLGRDKIKCLAILLRRSNLNKTSFLRVLVNEADE